MALYFIVINVLTGLLFAFDKRAARSRRRRVPEAVLHLMELAGGVAGALVGMYALRHKCRKFSFYAVTYLILLLWLAVPVLRVVASMSS